jgi:hypothetical protein
MPQMKGFLSTLVSSCCSTLGLAFFADSAAAGLAAAGSTAGKPRSSGLSLLHVFWRVSMCVRDRA